VFRSRQARACRERALVLTSQSIPFLQLEDGGGHRLLVEEHRAAHALAELRRYEEENVHFQKSRHLPPAAPFARSGAVALALVLVILAGAQWRAALDLDWTGRGAAVAGLIRDGELWRAATALTLHLDIPHLLSNLVFGLAFAYLVLHGFGAGVGSLALLLAGILGNYTNAWIQPVDHASIGASTAVFGALGLLGGSEWRTRHLLAEEGTRRFAPVGATLLLLLYLGVGEARPGRNVDVLAHVLGLAWGLGLGVLLPAIPRARIESRGAQLAAGAAALAVLALAWWIALGS
jgi:rhomboid protease GluP